MTPRLSLFLLVYLVCMSTALAQPASAGSANAGQAPPASVEPYGPLTFNIEKGGDFYVAQDGRFVKAELVAGTIRFHLHHKPFEIGTDVEQMNLALTVAKEDEVMSDAHGFRASRLAGPMQAARDPETLLVFAGKSWSDGNNVFEEGDAKPATPMPGYRHGWAVNKVDFIDHDDLKFDSFKGTLYGFICVYKDHVRRNSFIMPVEFVFE